MNMTENWDYAIDADQVDDEDVMPATVEGKELAIYNKVILVRCIPVHS